MNRRATIFALLSGLALPTLLTAALPPTRYPVSNFTTELQIITLGNQPARSGASLTLVDPGSPQASGIDLWDQDATGRFQPRQYVTLPSVVAHLPVRAGSGLYDDIFYVTFDGAQTGFGLLRGAGGAYDPSGTLLSAHPSSIAPPRGVIIAESHHMNGTPGVDVAVLVEPGRLAIFKDDGAGGLDPAFDLISLPSGTQGDQLAIGDVTGDGWDDVIVASSGTGEILVLENTTGAGPTTFGVLQQWAVTGLSSIALVDLDNGGPQQLDLMLVRPDELHVHLNSGAASPFGNPTIHPVDQDPVRISVNDLLPADGDSDVFVACRSGSTWGTLVELTNDGSGGLVRSGQYLIGSSGADDLASARFELLGLHDGSDGSFTIYPLSPDGLNASPADGIAAAAGPDPLATSQVRHYRGDGLPVPTADVVPYGSNMGARLGNGNIDGNEILHAADELLTGPGPNPAYGPHVRAFRRTGLALAAMARVSFFAYGTLRAGVNLNGVDVDGEETDEIVTGAGPVGVFGPHVRGFNFDNGPLQPIAGVNFFAYSTLRFGVEIGGGWDGESDGADEILTAPGPGPTFAGQIRGFDYVAPKLSALGRVNFVAFPSSFGHGATVVGGEIDEDGFDEIFVGRGPGLSQSAEYAGFDYDGRPVAALPGFNVTAFSTPYGGRIGAGNVDGDLIDDVDELIAGAGPDPSADSTLKVYLYDGSGLAAGAAFLASPGAGYGASSAGVFLGF